MSRGMFRREINRGHDAEIPVCRVVAKRCFRARTHDREGMIFREDEGKTGVLIIAELFWAVDGGSQPVTGGQGQVSPMG